jgi:hypothetical protein
MAVGAGATVYVMRRVSQAAESYGPAGLSRRASELADAVRYFADEVRAGMADRESELREALGIADNGDDVASYGPAVGAVTGPDEPRRTP